MRLIDADALCEELGITGTCKDCEHYRGWRCTDTIWSDVCNAIIDAPTVDAVPVVRCRDCKYYVPDGDGDPHGGCTMTYSYMSEDGYCSDGERKTKIEVLKRDKDM